MILNIISTVNGVENEGMRNIATHMIRELQGKCTVRQSPLGSPYACVKNTVGADAVLIFTRASAKTAILGKLLRLLCKNVYFVLVQKPEPAFMDKMGQGIAKFSFFTIAPDDAAEVREKGAVVYPLEVGIKKEKFRPANDAAEVSELRRRYGFSDDVPLVLHVGHLSEGRGLEEFLHLPKEKFQRLIVASGMFGSDEQEKKLLDDGVVILKEYLPDVSEVYRMADVYLFPTRSADHVISIPLSVTEALACGTPVVAFDGVAGLDMIMPTVNEALVKITDSAQLEDAVSTAADRFIDNRRNLLGGMCGWDEVAASLLEKLSAEK